METLVARIRSIEDPRQCSRGTWLPAANHNSLGIQFCKLLFDGALIMPMLGSVMPTEFALKDVIIVMKKEIIISTCTAKAHIERRAYVMTARLQAQGIVVPDNKAA
jgi:hypothetical protein